MKPTRVLPAQMHGLRSAEVLLVVDCIAAEDVDVDANADADGAEVSVAAAAAAAAAATAE